MYIAAYSIVKLLATGHGGDISFVTGSATVIIYHQVDLYYTPGEVFSD